LTKLLPLVSPIVLKKRSEPRDQSSEGMKRVSVTLIGWLAIIAIHVRSGVSQGKIPMFSLTDVLPAFYVNIHHSVFQY
jgi:hypothetical protein